METHSGNIPAPREPLDPVLAATIYEQHFRWMINVANSYGAGPDAQDIAQESVMEVLLADPPHNLQGFLRTVTRQNAIDTVRSAYRRREAASDLYDDSDQTPASHPTTDDFVERIEDRLLLLDAVSQLTERRRSIFLARYNDGLSVEEIAARLNLSKETIKQTLWQTKRQLRNILSTY